MKRTKTILIVFSLIIVISLIIGYLIPKNMPILSSFINKNSIQIDVEESLNIEMVNIELMIQGLYGDNVVIFENGISRTIPKGYGENDWFISYNDKNIAVFRHFKTNNWHDNHYSFFFYMKGIDLFCDIEIDGPDQMDKQTISLKRNL